MFEKKVSDVVQLLKEGKKLNRNIEKLQAEFMAETLSELQEGTLGLKRNALKKVLFVFAATNTSSICWIWTVKKLFLQRLNFALQNASKIRN